MDGLWTVEFGSSAGNAGAGVAVFQHGKIMGGDAGYYYVGQYELNNNNLTASLDVVPFIANYQSVFRTTGKVLKLKLEGTLLNATQAIAQGYLEDTPTLRFGAKLTKRR
jgi:hypothetical protein